MVQFADDFISQNMFKYMQSSLQFGTEQKSQDFD